MPELVLQILQLAIIPIAIGLLTSLLFLWFISRVRPKLKISSKVAKFESKKASKGYGYAIKVINESSRSAIEVNVRWSLIKEKIVPGGEIMRHIDLDIERNSLFEIPGYSKAEPEASAFRFVTYADLDTEWKDDKDYLLFVIYAKDSLTGFGKVISQKYFLKRDTFVNGSFERGTSMNIR